MPGPESTKALVSEALRLRGDLDAVRRGLSDDPETVVAQALPNEGPGIPAPEEDVVTTGGLESVAVEEEVSHATVAPRSVFEAGVRALEKIDEHGEDAELDDDEAVGLEAIVHLAARPAILFAGGRFADPPPPWGLLDGFRDRIQATAESVGRIDVAGQTRVPYAGTGFLVAGDVVMTNCHVTRVFAEAGADGRWAIRAGLGPAINFAANPDRDPPSRAPITEVIGVHPRVDLALLRVAAPEGGGRLPAPLTVLSSPPPPAEGERQLYALGYPAPDMRNDAEATRRIFGEIFYVKRLQPGAFFASLPGPVIRNAPCSAETGDDAVFAHDASTLGGNSGSCVVDLDTNRVAGLHYGGLYAKYNQAVALWKLGDDPLLAGAGVTFG